MNKSSKLNNSILNSFKILKIDGNNKEDKWKLKDKEKDKKYKK